jgi:hypothetical protein
MLIFQVLLFRNRNYQTWLKIIKISSLAIMPEYMTKKKSFKILPSAQPWTSRADQSGNVIA